MRNCAEHFRDDRDGMLDKSHHHLDLEIEPSKPTSVHLRCTLSAKHSIIDVFTHPRPVTTFPFIRMPIHLTYINFLTDYSSLLARAYLGSALGCCTISKLAPSLLLHAADFIGSNDPDCPRFLPGMRRTSEEKLSSLHAILDRFRRRFEVSTLRGLAEGKLTEQALVSHSASELN